MIAFACFVVEPQNALAVYDVREPVLERVIRFFNYPAWRRSKGPQIFMKYVGMTMEERDPLVAEWANTIRVEEAPTPQRQKPNAPRQHTRNMVPTTLFLPDHCPLPIDAVIICAMRPTEQRLTRAAARAQPALNEAAREPPGEAAC